VKLLFDQNIYFRIISKFETNFTVAKQTRQLKIENNAYYEIGRFAQDNGYITVTFTGYFVTYQI